MLGRSWDDDYPHYAAYVEAWQERRRTGGDDPSLLHDALARRGVRGSASAADRIVLDLLEEEWVRGSSPRRLRWSMAARAGRIVWDTVAAVVQTLRADDDSPSPDWAALPDDVLPMSDAARGWSVEDDRGLRVDEAGREVLRRVVATTRPVFGSHLADVWLRVCADSSAEVLAGTDVVGTVDLTGDDADRMRVAERHRVHADGALHVRSADDAVPTVQLWLPPHGPVHWPGLLAWLEELDDEDDRARRVSGRGRRGVPGARTCRAPR